MDNLCCIHIEVKYKLLIVIIIISSNQYHLVSSISVLIDTGEHEKYKENNERVDVADNCYTGKGKHYRGIVNKTRSNRACRNWAQTSEYQEHRDLLEGHNFCRNPGLKRDRPWCYLQEGSRQQTEYCDLPKCGM